MNTAENRRIVQDGLAQKKVLRLQREAEKEARQEAFEQDMIRACNIHCADVKKSRETIEQAAQKRAERAQAKAKAVELELKSVNAVRFYSMICLVILLASALTHLPLVVALVMMVSGSIFPAIYIFRLYNPIER